MKRLSVKTGGVGNRAPGRKRRLLGVGSREDDLGADIVWHELVDDIRREGREDRRHCTADRTPDEARFLDSQCFEERTGIAGIAWWCIAVRRSPLAVAMTRKSSATT